MWQKCVLCNTFFDSEHLSFLELCAIIQIVLCQVSNSNCHSLIHSHIDQCFSLILYMEVLCTALILSGNFFHIQRPDWNQTSFTHRPICKFFCCPYKTLIIYVIKILKFSAWKKFVSTVKKLLSFPAFLFA